MDRKGGVVLERDETKSVVGRLVDGALLAVLAEIDGANVLSDVADLSDVDVRGKGGKEWDAVCRTSGNTEGAVRVVTRVATEAEVSAARKGMIVKGGEC